MDSRCDDRGHRHCGEDHSFEPFGFHLELLSSGLGRIFPSVHIDVANETKVTGRPE
jgi:hypothetical protein